MDSTTNTCGSWKKDPCRKFYLHLLDLFAELEKRVPEHLKKGRGSTAELKSFNVFSKDHLDYCLFHSFLKLRKRMDNSDLRGSQQQTGKVIIWNTTYSRQFRNLGQVCVLEDQSGHVLPTVGVSRVARRNTNNSNSTNNEEAKLLKKTRDNFMVILTCTIRSGQHEFDTSLWIGMYIRKAVIHMIFHHNNKGDQMTKFVLNERTLAAHINSSSECGEMVELWDNHKSLTEYLKNNLFRLRKNQPNDVCDRNMDFLKTVFNPLEANPNKVLEKKRRCWVGALGRMSAEYLLSVYNHICENMAGRGVIRVQPFYVNEGVDDRMLTEESVDLGMMMRESYLSSKISSYLMYKIFVLRRLFRESRLKIGRCLDANNKDGSNREALSFLKVCKDFGLNTCKIASNPNTNR